MKECCVEGCPGPTDLEPVFFEFPTSRLLRRRWLDILTVPKLTLDALVCSRHFEDQDYEMVRGRMRLKSKVLPSLHVGESNDSESEDTESQDVETITGDIILTTNQDNITNSDSAQVNREIHNGNHESVRNENAENDDGNVVKNIENGNKHVGNVSENVKNDSGKVENDNKNVENDNKNAEKDNKNAENDNEKIQSDNKNVENKNVEKDVENHNRKAENENVKKLKRKILNRGKADKDNKRGGNKNMDSLPNGHMDSEDSTCSTDSSHQPPLPDKEDIEDSLTHYYIENKKTERQIAAMSETLQEDMEQAGSVGDDTDEVIFEDANPVFIEVSVGQEANTSGTATNDCLMLLESVQCDVDPELLLAARDLEAEECEHVDLSDDEPDPEPKKKPDTTEISLLTSSDEDDVIIQEPKIDTVTVSSDETDEDDVPLVKLVKTDSNQKKQGRIYRKLNKIGKILWGVNDYYCMQCGFTSSSKAFHLKHLKTHEKVLRVCQECGFTTCSEPQYIRHTRKHKNDKRFKCSHCNYSAKHSMSLVYHMKRHKSDGNDSEKGMEFSDNCVFIPTSEDIEKQHTKHNTHNSNTYEGNTQKSNIYEGNTQKSNTHKGKHRSGGDRYSCSFCSYWTKRKADLKRHNQTKHKDDVETSEDDDDEYKP